MSVLKKIGQFFGLSNSEVGGGNCRTYVVRTRTVRTKNGTVRQIPRSEIDRILLEDAINDLPPERQRLARQTQRREQVVSFAQIRAEARCRAEAKEREIMDLVEEIELGHKISMMLAEENAAKAAPETNAAPMIAASPEGLKSSLPSEQDRLKELIGKFDPEVRPLVKEYFDQHPELISIALDERQTLRLQIKDGRMHATGIISQRSSKTKAAV